MTRNMILGQRILLRPIEKKDIFLIKSWRNDPSVNENIFSYQFINDLQQELWFENYCSNPNEESFIIALKETQDAIGIIGLSRIDFKNQNAVLNTMIGEKSFWNKGYATEALHLLLAYAFNEMNLNRITSYIYRSNKASIRKNEKNGFIIEGTLRQMNFTGGKFHDVIVMGLLRADWQAKEDVTQE